MWIRTSDSLPEDNQSVWCCTKYGIFKGRLISNNIESEWHIEGPDRMEKVSNSLITHWHKLLELSWIKPDLDANQ